MPRAQWRRQRLRRPRIVLRPTVPVDRLLRASAEIRRQGGGASSALPGTGSSAVVVVPAAGEDGGEGDCGSGDGDSGSGDDGALASTTALTAAAGTPTGSGEDEGRTLAQTAWDSPSTPPAKSRQSRQSSTTTTTVTTTAASSPRLASPARRASPRGAGLLAEVDELSWRAERLAC
eukprot:scaffold24421_cov71-Phaeocystis_antarctica.AAC.4